MRLLTDKASDRKDFVHQLSRAVSRSRVIICCGPLFGESGLISGVSAAIGRTLETADNKANGIAGDDEIQIIKGSMPLVTSNGIFGGCIIESGPQSIILLSESKGIRKTFPKLIDYEVRIPPGGKTDALVETRITWEGTGEKALITVGVDSDQLAAAIQATEKMLNLTLI